MGCRQAGTGVLRSADRLGTRRCGEIVYVGDHPANDVEPARAAGLRTALLRRGPWGYLWSDDREVRADWRIDGLTELAALVTTD
ncbi:HAD family hydrolase [Actinomadura yumaensis]|uniref:HAD family hydrolase n=1 Tax=Actinomadura yumaensis TaxID=111807 RepID=UPI003610115E